MWPAGRGLGTPGLDNNTGLYGQGVGTVYKVQHQKDILQKIFNNFTIIQCSVTKITPHITGLLLVILRLLVWTNVLCHNFGGFSLGIIFINFTYIQCSVTKITPHITGLLLPAMFHLWVTDPGNLNLWIYFQLFQTQWSDLNLCEL